MHFKFKNSYIRFIIIYLSLLLYTFNIIYDNDEKTKDLSLENNLTNHTSELCKFI